MPNILDAVEARILGSLVEKSLTTPDLYPLSLNSLVNACNQKSSREPVMNLDFPAVEKGLKSLVEKGFVARRYEPGSRAEKFGHRIEILLNTEDPKIIAVICVLLLRGPQTLGEIKTRAERLFPFANTTEVDAVLRDLSTRFDGPIVTQLPRQTGQKEARFQQLFTDPAPANMPPTAPSEPNIAPAPKADRLAALEQRVAALEARLQALEKPAATQP